jgi:Zn-dependent peptidase ImmA (M78 family)
MKELLLRLERYGIGIRSLTFEDFEWICEELGVGIIYSDQKFTFTFTMMGETFIVLPKRMRGLKRLFRALHELGHVTLAHAQHEPHAAFYAVGTQWHDKNEVEADTIALVAMIPKHKIEEMAEEFGQTRYGDRLWRERMRLLFLYDI